MNLSADPRDAADPEYGTPDTDPSLTPMCVCCGERGCACTPEDIAQAEAHLAECRAARADAEQDRRRFGDDTFVVRAGR